MLPSFLTKPSPKLLNGIIVGLAIVLLGMGGLGLAGIKVPETIASTISDVAIVSALLVFFYNRKLRNETAKAAKAKEAEALASANAEAAPEAAAEAPCIPPSQAPSTHMP
ncbi:MAG: hypothetical protein WCQ50_05965 [Spirochaetota bacterium]